jgi:predicted kinase
MSDKGKLLFTMSPSHGGKSTFAKKWRAEDPLNRIVVTTDNIRLALHNQRYNKHMEPVVFAHKHVILKTLLLEGYPEILVCGTHTTRESIKRILEIDINAEPIIFDTPLKECIRRTQLTGQTDMIPVIKRHYKQLQELLDYGIEKVLVELKQEIYHRWDIDAANRI